MPITTTGDISYRTAGYMSKELLKRAQPLLCVTRLGHPKPLPKNSTRTIKFRGYQHIASQPKVLVEGVTPEASKPEFRDVFCTVEQYGDWVELTDVIKDTHEDPILNEFTDMLGEQSAIMLERVTIGKVLAGTNVYYSGTTGGVIATKRSGVNKPLNINLQRSVRRGLERQLAKPITKIVSASPNFNTSPIPQGFIAVCHTDLDSDIRDMPGFIPVEKYAQQQILPGEIGTVENIRYVGTTLLEPFADAGAASEAGQKAVLSTSGACADVYPILFFGQDAFGVIPLAREKSGASPITPMVLNPGVPRSGDPLGQRGSVSWKAYHGAVILYDFYMARVEVAASAL